MPSFKSALDLAAAIKRKDISPVEVAREYLEVIDRRDPEIRAFVWRRDDALLAEAAVAEAAVMRGEATAPFHGVPLPLKDLTEALDQVTTHGSLAAKDKLGRFDTSTVTSLRQAGFLFMGRTNTPEFGTLPVTENTLHGATRNPWNPAHTPGGSSGGAAAAVAAGMAPVAHASDGGGSIRIPAACCHLVGLKASRGRIPKGPWVSEIMHGFSTDGCVSTNVADTAAVLDALCRFDPNAWYGVAPPQVPFLTAAKQKPPRLRIGFTTKGPFPVPASPSAVAAVTRTATALSELGHKVDEATVDWGTDPKQLLQDFMAVWCTGSAYMDFSDWSQVEPVNQGMRAHALAQNSHDYVRAVVRLQIFSRRLVTAWGQTFDLLLTPTLAIEPPKIGWLTDGISNDPEKVLERCSEMVPHTAWCNVTGQPAIALPTYVAPSGLPMGVQLVGGPYREDLLLQVANELEGVFRWHEALPV